MSMQYNQYNITQTINLYIVIVSKLIKTWCIQAVISDYWQSTQTQQHVYT